MTSNRRRTILFAAAFTSKVPLSELSEITKGLTHADFHRFLFLVTTFSLPVGMAFLSAPANA